MAARQVVDIALLELGLPEQFGGNIELNEIMDFGITETDAGAEAVKTMRRSKRSIGFKKGVPDYEVDLEVKPVVGQEVPWEDLRIAGTLFPMFYTEGDGGQKFVVRDCLVTEISKSFNADGEATKSIKILALDHKPEAGSIF